MKNPLLFIYGTSIQKMCDPILVTLLKMQPYYSQSSRENATPSSSTSPLASYKEVPRPLGNWIGSRTPCSHGTVLCSAVCSRSIDNSRRVRLHKTKWASWDNHAITKENHLSKLSHIKCTPQDCIKEFIIRKLNLEVVAGLEWENNSARASRFSVHFFAVVARLRRESN